MIKNVGEKQNKSSEKFVIEGGLKLDGKIRAESAKNSVLPILAGTTLLSGDTVIKNCPAILDVLSMEEILSGADCIIKREDGDLSINADSQQKTDLPFSLTGKLRSSVFMLGAMLGKFKKAKISYPGGCKIGKRPVDIHIKALNDLGVKVNVTEGFIECDSRDFKGGKTVLFYPSVGATENVILASVLSCGETLIYNAAKEPEIKDLADFLNLAGAKIEGAGTSVIKITGVKKLYGIEYTPIFDRIEAGTYLIAAAITGGRVEIENVKHENILPLINKLCDYTCKIRVKDDIIYLKSGGKGKSFGFETGPYPNFPTDLQAPLFALALKAEGVSVIKEKVFENRFSHAVQFQKMGADIKIVKDTAYVSGVKSLSAKTLYAQDLRGGAALVLAGLCAEGFTAVKDVYHIDRGYLKMEEKINALGGNVKRLTE